MGLDGSLIDVPAFLRVWRLAGVRHLFLSPNAPGDEAVADAKTRNPVSDGAATPLAGPSPLSEVASPDHGMADEDPATWPEPWAGFWKRIQARRPRFVLTYYELGLDFAGKGDPRRGAGWRALIGELGWPAGTAAFWPLTVFSENRLSPAPEMFHKGVGLLRPERVLCFGAPAFAVISPGAPFEIGALTVQAVPVLALPGPEEALSDDRGGRNHVRAMLSALFSA